MDGIFSYLSHSHACARIANVHCRLQQEVPARRVEELQPQGNLQGAHRQSVCQEPADRHCRTGAHMSEELPLVERGRSQRRHGSARGIVPGRIAAMGQDQRGGSGRTEVNVHLQASVVWSYFSSHRRRRLGKAKPSSTFWCSGGSGSISDEAKNKVLGIKSHGSFEIAKQFEVKFFRVTYGCGLMCFSDQGFRESDEVKKWIELDVGSSLLTPDCQHSMADAFSLHGSNARDG